MAFIPFDDRPLDRQSAEQCEAQYRLGPLREQLCGQLRDWLRDRGRTEGEPPRIGLFGGLGQGKTSLINWVLDDLENERHPDQPSPSLTRQNAPHLAGVAVTDPALRPDRRTRLIKCKDLVVGPPVARFDVSRFKADHLEWRFLTALLLPRILRSLCLLWLPIIYLLLFAGYALAIIAVQSLIDACFQPAGNSYPPSDNLAACQAVASLQWLLSIRESYWSALFLPPALLAAVSWLVVRLAEPAFGLSTALYIAWTDWLFHLLAKWTRTLPKIVVIDDLDRAQVEQQRAFLRALRRFSRQMGFALVVCLDESELLAAPANPDAPDELLRKLIPFELRLPERGYEDVVHLALACCRQLAERNQGSARWHGIILSPLWLADVVRCALLLGPPGCCSPRRIKHLLNDVLLRAEQLDLRQAGDCCALLRLECLLHLAPALRRHSDALLQALESNRGESFERALRAAAVPEAQWPAVQRFFVRTRMMQPAAADGWFCLIGSLPIASGDDTIDAPVDDRKEHTVEIEFGRGGQELLRLYLTTLDYIGQGYPASVELEEGGGATKGDEPFFAFSVPSGNPLRFRKTDLAQPLHNCTAPLYWIFWVAALAVAEPAARRRLYAAAEVWRGAAAFRSSLLRERLADAEVWRTLSRDERAGLFERCSREDDGFRLATLSELLPDDATAAVHRIRTAHQIDHRRAAFWLATLDGTRLFEEKDTDQKAIGTALSARETIRLLELWPPGRGDDGETRLPATVLESIASRLALPCAGGFRLPNSWLADWRVWQSDALSTAECLNVLYLAGYLDGPGEWSLSRLRAWVRPEGGNDVLLPLANASLPAKLQVLAEKEDEKKYRLTLKDDELSASQRVTALALAVLVGWRLPKELIPRLSSIRPSTLAPLLDALFNDDLQIHNVHNDGLDKEKSSWLKLADPALVAGLLEGLTGIAPEHRRRWQQITRLILRQEADPIFVDAGWSPLLVDKCALRFECRDGRLAHRPAQDYLDSLSGLAKTGAKHAAYLAEGIEQLRELAAGAADLPERNRLLLDAGALAEGKWKEDFLPDLFDPQFLRSAATELRQRPDGPFEGLAGALEQAAENTWSSFDEFANQPMTLQNDPLPSPDSFDTGYSAYREWYRYYRDYLLLGISPQGMTPKLAMEKVEQRIERLREKAVAWAEPIGSAALADFTDEARDHVYSALRAFEWKGDAKGRAGP